MRLLIDAGNTRVKWALTASDATVPAVPGVWQAEGSITHDALARLAAQWQAQALPVNDINDISAVWISNVAGDALAKQLTYTLADAGIAPTALHWFTSLPARAGVRNGYREPSQLGCDRFAALIGARHHHPDRDLLVVNAGTATTVDALTADGRFTGGMILPGLGTMARSLAVNTAQLPSVSEVLLEHTLADNTRQAIISGCLSAQAGAIERAFAQHPGSSPLCLMSGGAASFIAPHLQVPHALVSNLVLAGLQVAASTETLA
jgi:type III pantothenate kinase